MIESGRKYGGRRGRCSLKTPLPTLMLLVTLGACGGNHTSLTSPDTGTYTLSGTVFVDNFPMPAVSVTIMDGIHAGQARITDGAGKYSFVDLTPSAFTLQAAATAAGVEAQNKAVNLTTANQLVNFLLFDH